MGDNCQAHFEKFYTSKHMGKRQMNIHWNLSRVRCHSGQFLKIKKRKKPLTFSMVGIQAVVLSCFENHKYKLQMSQVADMFHMKWDAHKTWSRAIKRKNEKEKVIVNGTGDF